MLGLTAPHSEQVRVLGNHRSAFSNWTPCHRHLYSNFLRNPARPASLRAFANRRFRSIPETFRVSTTTRPTGFATMADVALWWVSFLIAFIRAYIRCRCR